MRQKKILIRFFLLFVFLIVQLISDFDLKNKVFVILSMIFLIRLIYIFRDIRPLFMLFLFMFSYTMPFYQVFFLDKTVSYHASFNTPYFLSRVLEIFTLFIFGINFFIIKNLKYQFVSKRFKRSENKVVFYLLSLIVLFIALFALQGQNLLSGASYGDLDKDRSPMYEYSLIFLSILIFGFKNNFRNRVIIIGLSSFIILKDILYGGRVTSFMLLILLFYGYFEHKISTKRIVIYSVIFYFIMASLSVIRGNPALLLDGFKFGEIVEGFFAKNDNEIVTSNQGDIAQSSARLIGFTKKNILNQPRRTRALYEFVRSVFTPGFSQHELSNLSKYKKEEYSAGGGTLLPIYFYIWLSYFGIILISWFFSKIAIMFQSTNKEHILLFCILVMTTYPRWIGYSPNTMFKLSLYVIPIFLIIKNFIKIKQSKSLIY